MEGLIGWIAQVIDSTGSVSVTIGVAMIVLQWVFKKEMKVAFIDFVKAFKNLFANIPRRWESEADRVTAIKLALLSSSSSEDDVRAAIKEFAAWGYSFSRVIAGIVEDVLSIVVRAVVLVLPPVVGIYRRVVFNKKIGK